MAPGANYMGGKRNAARARSKDATGRVHKNFFGRQRLDILSKGLSGRAPSRGTSSGYGPRVSASDIGLSHARHLALPDQNTAPSPAPAPAVTPVTPHQSKSHRRSSSGSIRISRVLEALDTTEPTAMRAAMNTILSIPDLAGLSTRQDVRTPPRAPKRSRPPTESDSRREIKRQKSRNAPSRSSSSSSQQDENLAHQFEPIAVDAEESDDQSSSRDGDGYEAIHVCDPVQSSPALREPQLAAQSESKPLSTVTPSPFNRPCVSLGVTHDAQRSSPAKAEEGPNNFVLRDNLYDYPDPWKALGVILGLEDGLPNPAEILGHPNDEVAHSQHSSSTLSSHRSQASPARHHNASQPLISSVPLPPAPRTIVNEGHAAELPIDTSDASPNLKCSTPSWLDDPILPLDPLAGSTHHSAQSNPTTPLSFIKNKLSCYLDYSDDEDESLAKQTRVPSPSHSTQSNPTASLSISRLKSKPSFYLDDCDDEDKDETPGSEIHRSSRPTHSLTKSNPTIPLTRAGNKPHLSFHDSEDEEEDETPDEENPVFPRSTNCLTESNPTTPLFHVKAQPSVPLADSEDEHEEIPAAENNTSPPAGLKRGPFDATSDAPRLPRFAKFPVARDLKRSPTHTYAHIFTRSPRVIKFPQTAPFPNLEVLPSSALGPKHVESVDVEEPTAAATRCSPENLRAPRPADDLRVEDPEVARGTRADIPPTLHRQRLDDCVTVEHSEVAKGTGVDTQAPDEFVEGVPVEQNIEMDDVPCTPQPEEKFFGNLCLFSEDIDDPDSDD